MIKNHRVLSGAGYVNCPEPLLNYIIVEFSKLRQAYQALEEEVE